MRATLDLVVVGGGIAGLSAALRAAELGLRAIVLEQGEDRRYPCNTRFSGGIIHAAFFDLNRPVDELRALVTNATAPLGDPALVETLAVDGRRYLAWLRSHDVRFMRVGPAEAHRWCMAPPKPIAPGLEWRGRGPDVLLRTLAASLQRRGGELVLGARVQHLDRAACEWNVEALVAGKRMTVRTRGVVLADGGFQGNAGMLQQHVTASPARVLQRGAANSRGDGLRMAMEVGAAVDGLDAFYGHVQVRDALHDARLWPYPELDNVAAAGIVVDPNGRRICDEGLGGIAVANALARLADPASATLICDAAIWQGPGRSARFPANPFLERYGGTVQRADSVEKLATMANIDAVAVGATLREYNAAVQADGLAMLMPPRSTARWRAWPVVQPPFIAIPLCAGLTYTMGGIVIDGDGRVLDTRHRPIDGLYAAGSSTTGLEGRDSAGFVAYVGGLVKAVFGLRAAEHLAAELHGASAGLAAMG